MKRQKSDKTLDVVVAGLAVVDIIGKPIDLSHPPKKGGLRQIEDIILTTGGNVSNVGIDLAKLGFHVGAITRVGKDR
ncbi:MAG: carbohydrate kinase family protein, partial [Ignavibacteriales bacterium]|nr:carbohydrate kinase family protein [Ignavibacteriales bacterium]